MSCDSVEVSVVPLEMKAQCTSLLAACRCLDAAYDCIVWTEPVFEGMIDQTLFFPCRLDERVDATSKPSWFLRHARVRFSLGEPSRGLREVSDFECLTN